MTHLTGSPLILASTSRYRAELLARLRVEFDAVAPDVNETPRSGEMPDALAVRLAREKALAVAQRHMGRFVLGSDQVCDLDGIILGKPGTHERAVWQLEQLSGRIARFHTAIALVQPDGITVTEELDTVVVQFRSLSGDEIQRYLQAEQAYDCAGSAKSEGLGIALIESLESRDPTSLIGLPLIKTCRLLRRAGWAMP